MITTFVSGGDESHLARATSPMKRLFQRSGEEPERKDEARQEGVIGCRHRPNEAPQFSAVLRFISAQCTSRISSFQTRNVISSSRFKHAIFAQCIFLIVSHMWRKFLVPYFRFSNNAPRIEIRLEVLSHPLVALTSEIVLCQ